MPAPLHRHCIEGELLNRWCKHECYPPAGPSYTSEQSGSLYKQECLKSTLDLVDQGVSSKCLQCFEGEAKFGDPISCSIILPAPKASGECSLREMHSVCVHVRVYTGGLCACVPSMYACAVRIHVCYVYVCRVCMCVVCVCMPFVYACAVYTHGCCMRAVCVQVQCVYTYMHVGL